MSISDAAFLRWLKDDAQEKVILCHMGYMKEVGGAPVADTLYFADRPYVSAATDTPASKRYDGVLEWPNFTRSLDKQKLGGKITRTAGTMKLPNQDGLNEFILDLACDGSPISYYVGAPTWALADFRLIFSAFVGGLAGSLDSVDVSINDSSLLLNKTIGGDVLVGGTGANKDRSRPINAGYVHSAECILLDPSTQKYVFADRGSSDPDVPTTAAAIRVRGTDVSHTDNGDGTDTLTNSPDSPIVVAEVHAYQPTKYCISDLIDDLIATRCGLSGAGAWAGPHGSYVRYDSEDFHAGISIVDRRNGVDVFNDLCFSGLAFWGVTRQNQVTYGRIRPSSVAYIPLASSLTLTKDDWLSGPTIELAKPMYGEINVLGNKRWTVLTDIATGPDLGPTASLAIPGFVFNRPVSVADTYALAPEKYHLTLTPSPVFETLVSEPSDQINPPLVNAGDPVVVDQLTTWAEVYRRMFLPWVEFVSGTVPFHAYTLEIGDVVTNLMARFGWDDGTLFQALSIELQLNQRPLRVGLTIVRRRPGSNVIVGVSDCSLATEDGDLILCENGDTIAAECI